MIYFRQHIYPTIIIICGVSMLIVNLFFLEPIQVNAVIILLLITAFLWLCEHYYIPVNHYGFSFILPILFWTTLEWGLPLATELIGLVTLIDGFISKRWNTRMTLYPFYLMIALFISTFVTQSISSDFSLNWKLFNGNFVWCFVYTFLFFLIKNGLEYIEKDFKKKDRLGIVWSCLIFIVSVFYFWLELKVSHQNRGTIDSLAYFFFFSPLVGASLLASFIIGLQREKYRIGRLYELTTLANSGITDEDPIYKLVTHLRKLMPIDASILWLNEKDHWDVYHRNGLVQENLDVTKQLEKAFLTLYEVYESRDDNIALRFFKPAIKTFIFAPLRVEGDLIGMWAIGSSETTAYNKRDFQSFVTLANQVAAIAKTRRLLREKERISILEERNRIAREIHDGLGQTIAGSVLHLQSVNKSFDTNPSEAKRLVEKSLEKLRDSLSQVRSSIYELRPHPSERVSLLQAIQEHIEIFKEENPTINVRFKIRGKIKDIDCQQENGIFDIVKEGLRNIDKHSRATEVSMFIVFLDKSFCLIIRDNGVGFSLGEMLFKARSQPHFGLTNINEVAEQLGGTLDIRTRKNKGTKIIMTIPYLTKKEVEVSD